MGLLNAGKTFPRISFWLHKLVKPQMQTSIISVSFHFYTLIFSVDQSSDLRKGQIKGRPTDNKSSLTNNKAQSTSISFVALIFVWNFNFKNSRI